MEAYCERIELLKVPIDIVPRDKFEDVISALLRGSEGKNIVLLSLWDLLRARRSGEYREYIQNAALVIPISKSLVGGARFLTGKTPERYMPFNFIVNLLTILELRERTVYLLGGKIPVLTKAEKHIRETFPKLRIIGRFPGSFKKQSEETLIQVIRKSAPSLLLVNSGVHNGERWITRNSARLNTGLRLWCSDIFDVFAERRRRPSRVMFESGLEWIGFCFRNPLRIFRIFRYFYYNILLVIYKLRGTSNK
ncbi:MAG: WecB/TagA/CpsF family glycosyltransferase [Spirochaetaceae bacterium]|jgi:N-acetylglucosaminyldiphosphoundecaprenol N-acetyl-beta-D-mannosaminyltransferase|nr:WecB/TagA/CpsF family glycosyltransferase [Spirochaetaceae bacterium]